MSQHDDKVRVEHMIDAARLVIDWLEEQSRETFEANLLLQSAIAYQVQVIGEAASRISGDFTLGWTDIPWSNITGMRHILVHDYYRVDTRILWEVATVHLPTLATQLQGILDE